MNIVKAGYEIISGVDDKLGIMKKIERIARTCYKSEDLITETSCIKMIENLIKREHYAMLEHASLVFKVDKNSFYDTKGLVEHLEKGLIKNHEHETFKSYLRFTDDNQNYIISGNIRAWLEFLKTCMAFVGKIPSFFKCYIEVMEEIDIESDIPILFKDFIEVPDGMFAFPKSLVSVQRINPETLSIRERLIHQDLTVKFTVDRGVTHELVRHRDCSFAQESTRYCNYSKGKFGNEITVIEPCFWLDKPEEYTAWKNICEDIEKVYINLVNNGVSPQQARDVLPTSVKAEIYMTANICEWIHILELRALGVTGKPHPQMEEVMIPLAKEFVSGLLSDFTCIDSVNKMLLL